MEALGAELKQGLGRNSLRPQHSLVSLPLICSHNNLLAPTASVVGIPQLAKCFPVVPHTEVKGIIQYCTVRTYRILLYMGNPRKTVFFELRGIA